MTPKDVDRFWAKVDRSGGETACWEWTAFRDKDGYGKFRLGGTKQYAHRVAWMIANGEIPEGLFACHHCDTPSCCNPAHLWSGTHSDNMSDMVSKGRQAQGERVAHPGDQNGARTHPESRPRGDQHALAKLTEPQAREILALRGTGLLLREVAARFGIGLSQVFRIWRGEQWKHIHAPSSAPSNP